MGGGRGVGWLELLLLLLLNIVDQFLICMITFDMCKNCHLSWTVLCLIESNLTVQTIIFVTCLIVKASYSISTHFPSSSWIS